MEKDYLFDNMELVNISGTKILVDKIKWNCEKRDSGYICGYYEEDLLKDGEMKIREFKIESIGIYFFYNLDEIEYKDNIEKLRLYPKYAKYCRNVKNILSEELELEEQKQILLKRQLKRSEKLINFHNILSKKYKFEGFIHTTDFSNFINIMNSGYIYSRKEAIKKGLLKQDSADRRIVIGTDDYIKDHVRFYFRDQTPTHYKNEGIRDNSPEHHMPIPVMLIANKSLYRYEKILFTDGNVRNNNTKVIERLDDLYDLNFEQVFGEGGYNHLTYEERKEITRQRNAELLVPNKVSMDDIGEIVFRSKADFKMAELLFGKSLKYKIDKRRFYSTYQYCEDYLIELLDNNLFCRFKLNNNNSYRIKQFSHILVCKFAEDEVIKYDLLKEVLKFSNSDYDIMTLINLEEKASKLLEVTYLIDDNMSAIWRKNND